VLPTGGVVTNAQKPYRITRLSASAHRAQHLRPLSQAPVSGDPHPCRSPAGALGAQLVKSRGCALVRRFTKRAAGSVLSCGSPAAIVAASRGGPPWAPGRGYACADSRRVSALRWCALCRHPGRSLFFAPSLRVKLRGRRSTLTPFNQTSMQRPSGPRYDSLRTGCILQRRFSPEARA
jgi:hypothetical protein